MNTRAVLVLSLAALLCASVRAQADDGTVAEAANAANNDKLATDNSEAVQKAAQATLARQLNREAKRGQGYDTTGVVGECIISGAGNIILDGPSMKSCRECQFQCSRWEECKKWTYNGLSGPCTEIAPEIAPAAAP